MQLTLPQIEGKVREFAQVMFAPEDLIPTFGYSKESGLPHVEISDQKYHLVVSENGKQVSRESTEDPDELLFLIMHTISLSMACERMQSQTNYESFRMRLFQAQKNIISKINLAYMYRIKQKHDGMRTELMVS